MTMRKAATDNGFIIFKDQLSLLKIMPDEQIGRAIKLMLENFDELPEMNDIAYEMFASNVRRYREQSLKAREDGLRGGNPTLMGTLKLQEKKIQENNIKKENLIKEKNILVETGKFFLDDTMPEYKKYLKGLSDDQQAQIGAWILEKMQGRYVSKEWVVDRINQFRSSWGL